MDCGEVWVRAANARGAPPWVPRVHRGALTRRASSSRTARVVGMAGAPFLESVDASAWPRVRIALQGAPADNEECDAFLARLAEQYTRARAHGSRLLELELDVSRVAILRAARYVVNLVQFFGSDPAALDADDVTMGTVIAVAPGAEAAVNRIVALMPGSRPRVFVARGDVNTTERWFREWRASRAAQL